METYGTEGVTYEFANFIEQQFALEKIEKDLLSPICQLWIAENNQNPVGVIQVEYQKECPRGQIIAPEINKLYILRNFYGQGIGQNLMRLAEEAIRSGGYNKLWLWVLESNMRAVKFYLQQGFKNIGKADFKMQVNTYSNLVMLKNYD